MAEALDIELIRYKGLPIGTKIIAKETKIECLCGKLGLVVLKEKIYKEFIDKNFIYSGEELEEWYIEKILKKQKWHFYNKEEDLFMIADKKYKFFGYSYGCEYYKVNETKGKAIARISWDNIKEYIFSEKEGF